ncbi:hypothetical protein [uncultured Fibrobacter sp.]|uniref:hypothetical protein n=1 Tax=uncultured Fibrobacter sp. TaxID=261512 RepID=UPI0028057B3F|nr:hypothetical protein [uncultured Fibrobacter sp.]
MWLLFAILSALFAALTSILAKVGIESVNSNLATAIRTLVVVAIDKMSVVLTLVLAFIFLHEEFTVKSAVGSCLITAGTLMMVI